VTEGAGHRLDAGPSRAAFSRSAQEQLDQITQMDAILAQARELTHGFLHLIGHHSSEGLESWRKSVRASGIREFLTFAQSRERDKPAILAGLTLPYSTGPVEGHINRLKRDLSASLWPSWAFLLAAPLRGPQPDELDQETRTQLEEFAPVLNWPENHVLASNSFGL